jgi:predicted nuclease of predicted toxin-antitoxin system
MRFLADENFPLPSVRRLREADHDIAAIASEEPGIPDERVLFRAFRDDRIILTFDRDYGRLLYQSGFAPPAGVVYFRFVPYSLEEPAEYLLRLLGRPDFSVLGRLTVVERDRVRQRPLPEAR